MKMNSSLHQGVVVMNIRQTTQQFERMTLSEYAVLSENTAGRQRPEQECDIRTPFQRDRDRIIHSKAYRRLMHKTQMFFYPVGDHYRTRLTHTLEVSQIARTIARALRLNEDLTEAIAQGHDLGHTPFGHSGEAVLNDILGHFAHNEQSLRVVDVLEKNGKGLNLCQEVRDGILCHRSGMKPSTLEGAVVRYADKIAYLNHDIEDAVRGDILDEQSIPVSIQKVLGSNRSQRFQVLLGDLIEHSLDQDTVQMSQPVQKAYEQLRAFMFTEVYLNSRAKAEEKKVKHVLEELYMHYMAHPDVMPEEYRHILEREGKARAVCDYISGMSDRFAVAQFEELFIPKSWNVY